MTGRRSFFKIMINDFSKRLRIPPAFIKHINAKSPEGSILTSAGKDWHVGVNKIGDELYIERGWQDFVRGHSLKHGDLLIFRHHDDFKFNVEIFGRNGCEKLDCIANHDKISLSMERFETQYAREDLVNDRTKRVDDSSISGKAKGGLAIGDERQQEYKADVGESVNEKSDYLVHQNQADNCDIYIVSSSVETDSDKKNRKKMKSLQNSPHPQLHPCCRRVTRSSAVLSKSTDMGHEKGNGNHKGCVASFSGKMNYNHQSSLNETNVLCNSHHLKWIQSGRSETKETVAVKKVDNPIYEKENENYESDSASSSESIEICYRRPSKRMNAVQRSYYLRTFPSSTEKPREQNTVDGLENSDTPKHAKGLDSQSSTHSFMTDELWKPTQENESDESSSKVSLSLEQEVGEHFNEIASIEENENSSHFERLQFLGRKGSERTDEQKAFSELEYSQRTVVEYTPMSGRCSYYKFTSQRRSVTQEEKDRAIKAAKNFKSERPFFIVVMKPTHVYVGFCLRIPSLFVEAYIPEKVEHVFLTTSCDQKWLVKCLVWKHDRAKFSKGWEEFVWDNNLEVGDACLFELDRSNEFSFKVYLFRVVKEVVPVIRNRR